jgi:hypothetical protein
MRPLTLLASTVQAQAIAELRTLLDEVRARR